MNTSDYILKDVKPLSTTDTIATAKEAFKQLTFSHLPIVEEGGFLGLIAEYDVQAIIEDDKQIATHKDLFQTFFARNNTNWFELLKIFGLNEATIIPVVSEKSEYLGYYELADILHIFNSTPFLNQSGAVMLVAKGFNEYSFSEISQIVETNSAKILGAFISNANEDMVEITIKISTQDINNIIQSFRRYNYTILNSFHVDEYLNTLKERSNYLQKYLDI